MYEPLATFEGERVHKLDRTFQPRRPLTAVKTVSYVNLLCEVGRAHDKSAIRDETGEQIFAVLYFAPANASFEVTIFTTA